MFDRALVYLKDIFSVSDVDFGVSVGEALHFTIDGRYHFTLDERVDGTLLLTLSTEITPAMYEEFLQVVKNSAYANSNRVSFSVGYSNDQLLLMHVIDTDRELNTLDITINDFINMYENMRG